jgi:hypothetical protein
VLLDSNVVEILSEEKPSDTQRSRRTRIFILFYFTPVVPDELVTQNSGPLAVKSQDS